MKRKITNLRTRLHLISAIILLVGVGSAVLIYLTAEEDPINAGGYAVTGGNVYPATPGNSKMYVHDLELYGGKGNVLADEFIRWFVGLWQGKSLALTIVSIAFLLSAIIFFLANHMRSDLQSGVREENDRDGTGRQK
jgi:hypothetical protein